MSISQDQFDKLTRRVWELEQKYKHDERRTLDSVSLEMIYDQYRDMQKDMKLIKKMFAKIGVALFNRKYKNIPQPDENIQATNDHTTNNQCD